MRKISFIAVVICKNAYTVIMRKSQYILSNKLIDIKTRKIICIISDFLLEVLGSIKNYEKQRKK